MEDGPFKDAFPIENRDIFHCYVSLPEGKASEFRRDGFGALQG